MLDRPEKENYEANAIEKMRDGRPSKNVIVVLKHGLLKPGGPFRYYFDMELCDLNLRTCMRSEAARSEAARSEHARSENALAAIIHKLVLCLHPSSKSSIAGTPYILEIIGHIASGLSYIHKSNLTHRDLKPENGNLDILEKASLSVLLCLADGMWKLADFGFCKKGMSNEGISTSRGRGTDGYRGPELVNDEQHRQYHKRSDIWAFGCIIYELMFGTKRFRRDNDVTGYFADKHRIAIKGNPPDVSPSLNTLNTCLLSGIIEHSLRLVPGTRPPAREIYVVLKKCLLSQIDVWCRHCQHTQTGRDVVTAAEVVSTIPRHYKNRIGC